MFVCPRSCHRNYTNSPCMLPTPVARSFSGGVVMGYVLPVLWMTSCLLISQGRSTSPPSTRSLGLGYKLRSNTNCRPTDAGDYFSGARSNFPGGNTGAEFAVYDCLVMELFTSPGWLSSRAVSVLDSGAEGSGFKSQPRRCQVTVLGKLFTPIVFHHYDSFRSL